MLFLRQVNTLYLGAVSFLNSIISFIMHWYIMTNIGAGVSTDAFYGGMVPQMIFAAIIGSIVFVVFPLLSAEKDNDQFWHKSWTILQSAFCIFAALISLLYFTTHLWVPLLLPGFDEIGNALAVKVTRIQLIGILFSSLAALFSIIEHAQQKYINVQVARTVSLLCGYFFLVRYLPESGVIAAAWALVLVEFLWFGYLLLPSTRYYCLPRWNPAFFEIVVGRVKPLLLGSVYYKTEMLLDRFLSSYAPSGELSLLSLGQQVYSAPIRLYNKTIATPMIPLLASAAESKKWSEYRNIYRKRLILSAIIAAFSLFILFFFGESILQLVFGSKKMDDNDIKMLWLILLALFGFFVGSFFGDILTSSFYAKGDTVTPTKLGVITFTLGIGIKTVCFFSWGILGIAIGTSIYYIITITVQYVFLEKTLKYDE